MKYKSFIFLLAVIFFSAISFSELDASGSSVVNDRTRVYSKAELEFLEKRADNLSQKLQMDVLLAVLPDLESIEASYYVNDIYGNNSESFGKYKNGIIMAIHSKGEVVNIYSCGWADYYFPKKDLDNIMNNVLAKLERGLYFEAANSYFNDVEYYVTRTSFYKENFEGVKNIGAENNVTEGESAAGVDAINRILFGEEYFHRVRRQQCLFISFLAGFLFVFFMLPRKKIAYTASRSAYLENNTLSIIDKEDRLVDTQLTFEEM